MAKRKPQILWFARGGDVARSGPYDTQVEAARSLMVHRDCCKSKQWPRTAECDCGLAPIKGAFVWPEAKR